LKNAPIVTSKQQAWLLRVWQDPKMLADLDSRGTGNLESRTVTICSGLDLVNISYNHFVAADEKTAKVLAVTRV